MREVFIILSLYMHVNILKKYLNFDDIEILYV